YQLAFGALALGLGARLAQRALHRRRQACAAVLEDVVAGAFAQGRHRHVLADGPGYEDEGHLRRMLAHDLQGIVPGKPGHAEVGQHDVRFEPGQRLAQALLVLDPEVLGVEVRVLELEADQLRILGRVLDEEDPDFGVAAYGAQRHRLNLRYPAWR